MRFNVLTLFPEIPKAFLERELIACNLVNIRDFAFDKHRSCDDLTYGGGAGMLLLPEPLSLALDSVGAQQKRVIYVSPSGRLFDQRYAEELSAENELVFICGRYEGIDQRIIDEYVDDEISVGDYVMSSGEVAALVIIDAVYRLIEGVISGESLAEESFSDNLLEYPQYTRPRNFKGREVPDVLLSGHHRNIQRWRLKKRLEKTLKNRPDLLEKAKNSEYWTKDTEKLFKELQDERSYNED